MSKPSQKERILRALRAGPVRATAFSLPNVIDDGPPIFRVAARIQELRDAGYTIETELFSIGAARYTLVRDCDAPPVGGPTADTAGVDWEAGAGHQTGGHLFDDQPAPTGARPHWQEAA